MPTHAQQLLPNFRDPKSRNWAYFCTRDEVRKEPRLLGYAHHILRAFDALKLTGVLCVDGRPTIYFRRDEHPIAWLEANRLQRVFWNQGIATVLVLADPHNLRIYSGQAQPEKDGDGIENPSSLIATRGEDIADLLELESLLHDVASGRFYTQNATSFNEKNGVDECLLANLREARNELISGTHGLKEEAAHALLGRLVFLCYLTDRGVIDWADYATEVGKGIKDVRQLFEAYEAKEGFDRLHKLFRRLQRAFNGSMFDQNLDTERQHLRRSDYAVLRLFFSVSDVAARQGTLGFWAYDFSVIPVETISSIYEDFLTTEDAEGKRKTGAYYTPRHLAEMVVDTAISGDTQWATRRYLDPACGSGVFLVTLFNRLASHWVFENETKDYKTRAEALLHILHRQLCGVDIKRTACRIAAFSLYLAFLDQFDPRDLHDFASLAERSKRKVLPNLLRYKKGSAWREKHEPTVIEGDFLNLKAGGFDCFIGNPPWQGRGTKQFAWDFMRRAPKHLVAGGRGCLLLPAKVFFNKTDELQCEWFQTVSVERVINLSDFRHILFEHAKCPTLVVCFTNAKPGDDHRFLYETPKVSGSDCRDGVVAIFPQERKQLRQDALFAALGREQAPSFWKRHFSGTPRDWRLLDLLEDMPRLSAVAKHPSEDKDEAARWYKGQGIQPSGGDHNKPWWGEDRLFLGARPKSTALMVFEEDCEPVGKRFHPYVHRPRDARLFVPPLVVVSQGFGKVAFCDFPVLFQDSLQSITVASQDSRKRAADADLLIFLCVYLRSRLARYYLYHTSANWGVERDKVHLFELLQLPFPLPGDNYASPKAEAIVAKVAVAVRGLRTEIAPGLKKLHKEREKLGLTCESKEFLARLHTFNEERMKRVDALQTRLERDICRYFDLTDEETALIEDTATVIEPSSTPTTRKDVREAALPSLEDIEDPGLRNYATMLTATLNHWAEGGSFRVEASAVRFTVRPVVLFTLRKTREPQPFHFGKLTKSIESTLSRIHAAGVERQGRWEYPRTVTLFEGSFIYLLKPTGCIHWTRTAALNDADEIFAEVIRQRRGKSA